MNQAVPKGKIQIASELFSHINEMYINSVPRPVIKQSLDLCKKLIDVLDSETPIKKIEEPTPEPKKIEIPKKVEAKKEEPKKIEPKTFEITREEYEKLKRNDPIKRAPAKRRKQTRRGRK